MDIITPAPLSAQADSPYRKRPKRSALALELYEVCAKIIELSPDRSCFASERALAKYLHRRVEHVAAAKRELIAGGWLKLSYRPNGNRRNPRHRLTLPAPAPKKKKDLASTYNAFLKSRTPEIDENSGVHLMNAQAQDQHGMHVSARLMALDIWHTMPRVDLIDCYLKSDMGGVVCPVERYRKKPTVSRGTWAKKSREQRIDVFYHDPDLNVGLWIGPDRTVFDFDSERSVDQFETLISSSRNGARHHLHFEADPEIYNTAKQCAEDVDTRAVGGLILLPPSVHPDTGDPYVWEMLRAPSVIPAELLALWNNRKTNGAVTGFKLADLPDEILKGERDNTIWSYGRRLRACGVVFDELAERLRIINQERCKPAFSERYMEMKIRHIWEHRNDPEKWTERVY